MKNEDIERSENADVSSDAAVCYTANQPATAIQKAPKGNSEPIVDMVIKDLQKRAEVGEKKYGEKLKAFNGRDAMVDAYQEALDLCCYLRQAIYEWDYESARRV